MAGESSSAGPEGLPSQLPYVREPARSLTLRGVSETARAGLEEIGQPWDGKPDASVERFLGQYTGPSEQIQDGAKLGGDVLDSTADGIQTMADGLARIEAGNADAAQSLLTSLDSGSRPSTGGGGGRPPGAGR